MRIILPLTIIFIAIPAFGKERGRKRSSPVADNEMRELKYGTKVPTSSPTSFDDRAAESNKGLPSPGVIVPGSNLTLEPSNAPSDTLGSNSTEVPTDSPTETQVTDSTVPTPVTFTPVETSSPEPLPPTLAPTNPTLSSFSEPSAQTTEEEFVLRSLEQALVSLDYNQSVFLNPNSYQYQAAQWTAVQEGVLSFSRIKLLQYWILYCIYYATNVPIDTSTFEVQHDAFISSWANQDGWKETSMDPCDGWYGISCDNNGLISEIHLQRNNLSGYFPPEVSFLAFDGEHSTGAGNLTVLEIFNNELLTSPPNDDSWISLLGSGLKVLNYGSTSFKGPIPRLPSSLVEFDCSYTLHSGPIPEASFEGLDNLTLLILDGNDYSSAVPSIFGLLPNLRYFYVRESSLQGDLSYMEGMPSIVEHLVDGNPGISGPLYSFLGQLTSLRSFSASDCGLTGWLPKELANISGLVQIWLYGNKLSGVIPSEYGKLDELRILALEDTDISGSMPIEICLNRFNGALTTLSVDCIEDVQCGAFFPDCCTCCGRADCGT